MWLLAVMEHVFGGKNKKQKTIRLPAKNESHKNSV
jgi:hypothetical protein